MATQDLEVKLLIDSKQFQQSLRSIAGSADTTVKGIENAFKNVDVKIDPKQAGQAFAEVQAAAKKSVEEQKLALAALAASGQKGSKEYQQVKKELLDSQEAAKKLDKAVEDVDKELGEAGKSASLFGSVFSGAFAADIAGRAVSSVVGLGQAALQEYKALDTNIANIGTLGVEEAGQSLDRFKELIVETSKTIPDEASNIAAGVYNAISAGVQGTEEEIVAFAATAGKVAVAGLSDTNTAVNALTSVTNAYKSAGLDATQASNIFFGAIKAGKTSFAELNQGLASVIPAASAAGVSFEEVAGSVAQLTTVGIPTAQATTQIRAAIIELQKPGKPLADALAKIGLNASNMAAELAKPVEEGGGLVNVLQRLEASAAESGQSLTQIFSSSEAASAGLSLTGQNAENTLKILGDVRNAVADGAADKAFEAASQSIDVQLGLIKNQVTAVFTEIFSSAGSTLVPAIRAFADEFLPRLIAAFNGIKEALAPVISAIATGIGALVGGVFLVFVNLIEKVAEGLQVLAPILPVIVGGLAAWAVVQNAQVIATTAATAAQAVFNAVASANPIGAVVLAITAAVAAYKLLEDALTDSAAEQLEAAEAQKEVLQSQIDSNKEQQKQVQGTQALAEEYEKLATKQDRTAAETAKLESIQRKLGQEYPELVSQSKSFAENLDGVRQAGKLAAGELKDLTEEASQLEKAMERTNKQLAGLKRNAAIEELDSSFGSINFASLAVFGLSDENKFRQDLQAAVNRFKSEIYKAASDADIQKAQGKLLDLLYLRGSELDDDTQLQDIIGKVLGASEAAKAALRAWGLETDVVTEKTDDLNNTQNNNNNTTKKTAAEAIAAAKAKLDLEQQTLENKVEQARQAALQAAIEQGRAELTKQEETELNKLEIAGRQKLLALANDLLKVQRDAAGQVVDVKLAATLPAEERAKTQQELISLVAGYASDLQGVVLDNLKLGAADLTELGKDAKAIIEAAKKQIEADVDRVIKLEIEVDTFTASTDKQLENARAAAANLQAAIEQAIQAGDTKRAEALAKDLKSAEALIEELQRKRDAAVGTATEKLLDREISLIEDAEERRYKQELLALERRKNAELAQAGLTIQQRRVLEQRFAEERKQLEEDYYQKVNKNLYTLGIALESLFADLFKTPEVDREALDAIDEQEQAELASLKRRENAYEDYVGKLDELDRERADVIAEASISIEERLKESIAALQPELDKQTEDLLTSFQTQAEGGTIAYDQIGAAAAINFGAMIAAGEKAEKAIIKGLIKTASQAIDVYIPQIIAAFTSWLGPFGIPAAFAAIGLVKGLLAQASAGFYEGGYTGDVGTREVAGVVHGKEYVHDHKVTAKYRPLFDYMRAGGDPKDYYRAERLDTAGTSAIVERLDSLEKTTRKLGKQIERKTDVAVTGKLTADGSSLTALVEGSKRSYANRV